MEDDTCFQGPLFTVYDDATGNWMTVCENYSVLFLQLFWKSKITTFPLKLALRKMPVGIG